MGKIAPTAPADSSSAAPRRNLDIAAVALSIGEVAYCWDIATDAIEWSPNACGVFNIPDIAAIASGRAYTGALAKETSNPREAAVMHSALRDTGAGVAYEVQYAIRAGATTAPLWVEDSGRWFAGPDGRPARAHGMIRPIGERHAHEQRLIDLARFDDLTGELSRRSIIETLTAAFDAASKLRSSLGFLVVSVDDLARVNEAYGFAVGDEVIAVCARRLRERMRGRDHLGRLCGNKFGIILNECSSADLAAAAERFLGAIRDDVIRTVAGPVAVTASAGGVIAPRHAETVSEVLARAHEALIAGRIKRRGSMEVFRPNAARDALRRDNMRAADEIIAALNERRILAAFEPVAEVRSRRPAFYECLMRIQRADGTLVLANDIMPVAERLGLVRLIDHRMLELVIAEMAAAADIQLSFNVSPTSINDEAWCNTLAASLASNSAMARRLTLEITESTAIADIDEACALVARLKGFGCRIALDDFGAGYTSFRNMRRLGVDLIKIDGGFVKDLAASADDQAFVRTLINLAKQVGLSTVAEWVQDERAAAMLTAWGCDYLQGALIGTAGELPRTDGIRRMPEAG